ncbi:MAG: hypothetical protein CPSOU_0086 [uncultured Paraburkholderia sp.]|nr:MAG: hypothetical protein CPSOU_0086 [uncultured Paraburkholderia sp.]
MPNCVLLKPETVDACGKRRIFPHRFYTSRYFGNRNDFSLYALAPTARTARSQDSVSGVASAASQSGAENENGVPRTQSLTESGDAVVLNLVLQQALCVRSRRIAVDPMAGLNAKAMPTTLPTPVSPAARDFARKRARLRPASCATHFDAARHSDGATQHFARAKSGRAPRGLLLLMRQAVAARYAREACRHARPAPAERPCSARSSFTAIAWPGLCVSMARIESPLHATQHERRPNRRARR